MAQTPRLTRRAFLGLAGAAAALAAPRRAGAQASVTVGLLLPPPSPAATALEQGALLGLDDANALATLFGKRLQLGRETAADAGAAAAAASALVRQTGAIAVVGGAGPGFGEALRDAVGEAAVFLNAGAPDDRLRNERCGRQSFHLAPSVAMYVDALAQRLVAERRLGRWALVGDGSARSREIEAAARRALDRRGGSLVDDAGAADVLLLALDPAGARDALARLRAAGRAAVVAGVGGEVPATLRPDDAAGIWAVGWHQELERFSARELNSRFRRRFRAPLDETSWAAWAALKLVGEAVVRGGATDAAGLVGFFESASPFDGHKGTALIFRKWDHQLRQPLYLVGPRRREAVTERRGPFEVVAELGGPSLDALGTPAAESRCRLVP